MQYGLEKVCFRHRGRNSYGCQWPLVWCLTEPRDLVGAELSWWNRHLRFFLVRTRSTAVMLIMFAFVLFILLKLFRVE